MMQSGSEADPTQDPKPTRPHADRGRRAYVAPALEPLGRWNALTLAQSVPVAFDLLYTDLEW